MESAASLNDVVGLLAWSAWNHRGAPTGTMINAKEDALLMIEDAQIALDRIGESVEALKEKATTQGVPFWD
jgi:hypothetical protein